MPRKPGRQQGIRRYQRYGQTALDLGRTLDVKFSIPVEEDDGMAFVGICQSCGAYWDVRLYPRCPAPCGGYIG